MASSISTSPAPVTTGTSFDFGTLHISCNGTTCTGSLIQGPDAAGIFGNNFLSFNLASGASAPTLTALVAGDCKGADCASVSTNVQVDGWGSFAYSIDLPDGPNNGIPTFIPSGSDIFTTNFNGTADTLLAVPLDLGGRQSIRDAFRATVLAFGGVDVLVNTAAVRAHSDLHGGKPRALTEGMDSGEFRCPVCGAEFVSQEELDQHQRATHTP